MKNGGFKGGNLSPFCKRKGHQNSVLWTVCYACLGKLHRLHDGDFGKNTILEKHEIHDRRESNFGEIVKVGKSFAEIMSYKQTPVLSL